MNQQNTITQIIQNTIPNTLRTAQSPQSTDAWNNITDMPPQEWHQICQTTAKQILQHLNPPTSPTNKPE